MMGRPRGRDGPSGTSLVEFGPAVRLPAPRAGTAARDAGDDQTLGVPVRPLRVITISPRGSWKPAGITWGILVRPEAPAHMGEHVDQLRVKTSVRCCGFRPAQTMGRAGEIAHP